MSTIRNNTPRVIFNGIKDESIEQLIPELEAEPIHLPLIYTFTQKGPEEPVLCGPNGDFKRIYGSESLNPRSPYYTHATKMIETISGEANSVMIKRLIPDDARTAGMTLMAKLVRKTGAGGAFYRKARNPDGSFVINSVGATSKYMYINSAPGASILATDGEWTPTFLNGVFEPTSVPAGAEGKSYIITGMQAYDKTILGTTYLNNGHVITFDAIDADVNPINAAYKPYQTKAALVALDGTPEYVEDSIILGWDWVAVEYDNLGLVPNQSKITYSANTPENGFETLLIPIKTMYASSPGAYGNNLGYREGINRDYDLEIVDDNKALVIKSQFVERSKPGRFPYIKETLTGSSSVEFTYNPAAYNSNTQENLYINNIVDYYNDDGVLAGTSPTYGPCSEIVLHEVAYVDAPTLAAIGVEFNAFVTAGITKNIEVLYMILATVEADARAAETGKIVLSAGVYGANGVAIGAFDENTDQMLLDIFTGISADAVPYYGFKISSQDAINLNESYPTLVVGNTATFDSLTVTYMGGGEDGTLTKAIMEEQLILELTQNYNNPEYDLTDTGRYPFSCVYDSGYTAPTKEHLFNWLDYRKDVHVTVGTHAEGEKLDIATEESRAAQLINAARLHAESEEFGTKCVRAVIVAHSSVFSRGIFTARLPLTFELAQKRARYLGAGNGIIKYGLDYTQIPLNTIELMNPGKINNIFMSYPNREMLWGSGANFVQFADRSTVFFPALQTVYDPRNSVLTSELIMQIAVDVEKQCDKVWKLLSGNTDLTKEQFLQRSNEELSKLTSGKYGSRVNVIPNAYFTAADDARGYSWVMEAIIYGNVMKTVATVNVIVRRQIA